jgi:membrane protease YdiL (CAAX protease family)
VTLVDDSTKSLPQHGTSHLQTLGGKSPSRFALVVEVLLFIGLAIVLKFLVNQLTLRFSGPISLVMVLVILTFYLRTRGLKWSDMGLRALPGVKAKLLVIPQSFLVALVFLAFVGPVMYAAEVFGWEALTETPVGIQERFNNVRGNLPMFLLWLVIVWTTTAFGEEMFFRGYLITRLQSAFTDLRFGNALAVIAPALLFGFAHVSYQGVRGLVMTGLIGLAFGTMFLVFKRNLWPLVLWHGITNSMSFTVLYLGLE